MVEGVILAAGASSRMGRPKAALPIGGRGETCLSRLARTLLAAGLPRVTVVAGADVEAVRGALPPRERRVRLVEHAGWARGQLSSLQAGLDAVVDETLEAVLVALVDVPLISPDTVRALVGAWRAARAPITRPVSGPRHGHPVIFDRSVFEELRHADPAVGAKAVFAAHSGEVLDVEVRDPGAFQDLDTPEDYQAVQTGWMP
jgi:CTP:molybdopterin cytidylyltransferase MocA